MRHSEILWWRVLACCNTAPHGLHSNSKANVGRPKQTRQRAAEKKKWSKQQRLPKGHGKPGWQKPARPTACSGAPRGKRPPMVHGHQWDSTICNQAAGEPALGGCTPHCSVALRPTLLANTIWCWAVWCVVCRPAVLGFLWCQAMGSGNCTPCPKVVQPPCCSACACVGPRPTRVAQVWA